MRIHEPLMQHLWGRWHCFLCGGIMPCLAERCMFWLWDPVRRERCQSLLITLLLRCSPPVTPVQSDWRSSSRASPYVMPIPTPLLQTLPSYSHSQGNILFQYASK